MSEVYRNRKGQFATFEQYKKELRSVAAKIENDMKNSPEFIKWCGQR